MEIQISKKLNASELEGLKSTQTYENLMKNKLHIFSKTTEDDTLWDLLKHFEQNAQGVFFMSTLGNDNIWRIYFENTGDMTSFLQLIQATNKKPDNIGPIESVVVNTTHDTE